MVKLWKSKHVENMFISHAAGLSAEQIEFFKSLKAGDKVVLFGNDDDSFTLKKNAPKKETE